MFETFEFVSLQQYWWLIIALLGGILVMMLFVQGGQTLLWQVGKNDDERRLVLNSIGRKWDLTFTTLVTFGGAFFASFPLFYATSFSGAYWAWTIILFSFIIQAVSYEFRGKAGNFLGAKTFETFLLINGILAPVLLGVAVASFFSGSEFTVDMYNIPEWQNSGRGFELLMSGFNISLGLSVFFLSRILGAQYLINNIQEDIIRQRCRKTQRIDAGIFLLFFLSFIGMLLFKDGYGVDASGHVSMVPFKYLLNLIQMPAVLILLLAGVLLVLFGIYTSLFGKSVKSIWFTASGTFLTVFSLFLVAAFNGTAYYPSSHDLQSSLTIYNSSSSQYTLTAMSYVSLGVPFVIAYIWKVWTSMDAKKLDLDEIRSGKELY